jgi:uncharacterized protein (DUF302 family)
MKKIFLTLLCIAFISTAYADNSSSNKAVTTQAKTTEKKTVEEPKSVIVTKAGASFEDINESVRMAIADGGMIVSGTLHISDMLNRTGKDIGFDKNIFKKSEAVEFCSALISHKMAAVHPSNVSMCPFTVAIYELNDEPGVVYLSYRRVNLLGDGKKVEEDILTLLQGIVDESVE